MAKFNKSQVLMLLVLALLLIITPFLPSSLKPTFLYFIVNLLIITLGAEAGFLSAFPRPSSSEDKKFSSAVPDKKEASTSASGSGNVSFSELSEKKKPKIVLEKFDKVKSASMPSLLFVGEAEAVEEEEIDEEDEVAGINGQELFAKADAFIRNFYKQLRTQQRD
ncbi:uncharacterized protein LOC129295557 [Prosopis cineraria]|uniref:uncharacterized protein LOC129295557 n=1 Tax=Prosopis cineraria TaxID=364024 RepID=UPI00240EA408|nr:uncharacterized protein LOC129295557 [Prosopis cineraria]